MLAVNNTHRARTQMQSQVRRLIALQTKHNCCVWVATQIHAAHTRLYMHHHYAPVCLETLCASLAQQVARESHNLKVVSSILTVRNFFNRCVQASRGLSREVPRCSDGVLATRDHAKCHSLTMIKPMM